MLTAVGMMSFLPFFPSLMEAVGVEGRGALAAWTGVAFGAAPFTAALMGPVWGTIGDRFGRKAMVLRAYLAIVVFVGAMGFAQTPWQLLALRIGQGMFAGFVPPSITLVSIAAPKSVQGRISGSLQASLAVGTIIGPLLGAQVLDVFGLRTLLLLVAALAALATLTVAFFAHEEAGMRAVMETWSPTSVLAHAWKDLRRLLANPKLRLAVLILFALQFGVGSTNPLMEIYVRDLGEGDPDRARHLTAVLFSALAAAALVASPLWGRYGDRVGHRRALLQAGAFAALVLMGHAVAMVFAGLLACRILIGISVGGTNATAFGLAATQTEPAERGAAFGAVFSARAMAMSLGAISGGALSSLLGIPGLFLLAGGIVLAVIAVIVARPS